MDVGESPVVEGTFFEWAILDSNPPGITGGGFRFSGPRDRVAVI
jgi:hypothetical protein